MCAASRFKCLRYLTLR